MLMHQKSNLDRIRGVHAYSWRADKHAEGGGRDAMKGREGVGECLDAR